MARFGAPGARAISNSIRATRRRRTRSSREVEGGADSIAASPARALLQARQRTWPSRRDQLTGIFAGFPSILPTETWQRMQLHLTASPAIASGRCLAAPSAIATAARRSRASVGLRQPVA